MFTKYVYTHINFEYDALSVTLDPPTSIALSVGGVEIMRSRYRSSENRYHSALCQLYYKLLLLLLNSATENMPVARMITPFAANQLSESESENRAATPDSLASVEILYGEDVGLFKK